MHRKMLLFCSLLLVLVLASPAEVSALPGQTDLWATRCQLLSGAVSELGVCSPEQAATVWANGLQRHDAALQYCVMTDKLKKEYARRLETACPDWVTGQSGPWVQSYTIKKTVKPDELHAKISLLFEIVSSAGPPRFYNAHLWLAREGDFWRISRLQTDTGLLVYTCFAA